MSTADYIADFFQNLDVNLLSEQERRELLDFYNSFLNRRQRKGKQYEKRSKKKSSKVLRSSLLTFSVREFEPLKRDQIYAR